MTDTAATQTAVPVPAPGGQPAGGATEVSSLADQVRSLIPAEITAVFLALNANIVNDDVENKYFLGFFIALAVICFFYSKYLVGLKGWWRPLVVAFVVFPAWALVIAWERIDAFASRAFLPTALMLILGLLVPFFVASRDARQGTQS